VCILCAYCVYIVCKLCVYCVSLNLYFVGHRRQIDTNKFLATNLYSMMQSCLLNCKFRQIYTAAVMVCVRWNIRPPLLLHHTTHSTHSHTYQTTLYILHTTHYTLPHHHTLRTTPLQMEVMADCVLAKRHLVPYWRRNLVNKEVIADQEFLLPADFLESELSADVKVGVVVYIGWVYGVVWCMLCELGSVKLWVLHIHVCFWPAGRISEIIQIIPVL